MGAQRHQCRVQKAALPSICAHSQHSSGGEALSLMSRECVALFQHTAMSNAPKVLHVLGATPDAFRLNGQFQPMSIPVLCVLRADRRLSCAPLVSPLRPLLQQAAMHCRRMKFCRRGQCATAIWWSVSGRRTRQRPRSSGSESICSCQWRPPAASVTSGWALAAVPPGYTSSLGRRYC